ncbi:MAG: lipocalin family protein [Cyclobacteriaceae bacterium]
MNKFQLIISILVLSLIFASCGEDESDNDEMPEPQSDLVGNWNITSYDFNIDFNGQDFIQFFIDALELSEEEAIELETLFIEGADIEDFDEFEQIIFTFNADGTYTIIDPVDGDENGIYSVNNDETEITFTSEGESYTMQIGTLTAVRLTLIIAEEIIEDVDEDGQLDTISARAELELSKN